MLIIGICLMVVYIKTVIMNYYIEHIEVNNNENFINMFTLKLFKSNTETTLIPFNEYTYSEYIYSVMTGNKRICIKYKNIKFKIDDNWFTIDEFNELRQTLKLYAKNKVEDGW